MHNFPLKPILWLAVLIFSVSLACGLGGGDPTPSLPPPPTDAPTPTDVPVQPTETSTQTPLPSNTPVPTDPPPPTPTTGLQLDPTDTQVVSTDPEAYYVEEFEGNLENYSYFVFTGVDRGDDMVFTQNGSLSFNIADEQTWVYVTYDPWVYGDVRIGLSAENRGVNSQRVSLL